MLDPPSGGIHQYTLTMLDALAQTGLPGWIELALVLQPNDVALLPMNLPHAWRRIIISALDAGAEPGARGASIPGSAGVDKLPPLGLNSRIAQYLRAKKIEWLLFTSSYYSGPLPFEFNLPYVMPVHDLQHRLHPEFPEVSENGEWEQREFLFRNGIQGASVVLVDSEVGKQDVLTFYSEHGARSDRIAILPFLPAAYHHAAVSDAEKLRVRATYNLPARFLFYPAQFWPHKNHRRIVEAIAEARDRGLIIHAVFCGSATEAIRQATMQEVVAVAQKRGVADQIRLLGYVPNEDMSPLYAQAVALIMPTFFGPTNIPVVEAWASGCPVLTSDIRGIREQVGDAALLVDPRSVQSITDGILRIWQDAHLRASLEIRGQERLAAYTPVDFCSRLAEVILNMSHRAAAGEIP